MTLKYVSRDIEESDGGNAWDPKYKRKPNVVLNLNYYKRQKYAWNQITSGRVVICYHFKYKSSFDRAARLPQILREICHEMLAARWNGKFGVRGIFFEVEGHEKNGVFETTFHFSCNRRQGGLKNIGG